ncbi:uncharacterized protein [Centroberyx affinis]|uniref:uncharacterized protein n=1 Tax=Centroberyx affinis TaxID=166261 RepID=UPI003A5BE1B0
MAISKNGLTLFALIVTLYILETQEFIEISSLVSPVHYAEDLLPHIREKRNVPTDRWNYIIEVEVNASNTETIEQIRTIVNTTSLPIQLDNATQISDIGISTVCSANGTGFQCRCEEQFAWPYSSCVTYGACDHITSGICKCINAIPAEGQHCQPISALLALVEYEVELELNVSDFETVGVLKSLLVNNSFSLALGPTVNVTDIIVTTVCSPNGTSFQCKCEEQFVWSSDNCMKYGACDDEIINGTCGCINSIPSDGQYCQAKSVPPVLYEYLIYIEVNTSESTITHQLRNTLRNTTFPVQINTQVNISDVDITTVCSQNGTGVQCRCEEDHLWPCDKCATYGKCDGDTNDTCGCIKAIPTDGRYCQSVHHQNFTACPLTTPSAPPSTTPPLVNEYLVSIELNTTDVRVIDQLRIVLRNTSFPISINNTIQISDVNISTVCSPTSAGFQCRCEDQYRWSCDQCFLHGSCDNITDDTCGCINAIPPDGQYCQSVDQHNFTACPLTTPSPPPTTPPVVYEYLVSIELNTTDVTVINLLRTVLRNTSFPISINNTMQISEVNISTVCSPSSAGFQCRCEDQYRWSCDQCFLHGSCDNITDDTCGCINAIPPDGQYCQSVDQHTPPLVNEYLVSIELNTTDVTVINLLRTVLRNTSFPISINNTIQISDVNISTVCSPTSTGFQCRCEDQYRWSCDQCFLHGSCDNITDDTCGCINAIPPDGQYCQSVDQHNFTACPLTTPSPPPTTPPVIYEYLVSIELNTTDVTVIDRLRTVLRNTSFPISINNTIQISEVNISTVCNQNGTTSQCRCEEQYSWPCDLCTTFGKCDDTTDSTCGCINAIPPDGQFCQPFSNLLICPSTTPQTVTDTTTIAITVQNTTAVLTTLPTAVTNSTTAPTTQENITTIPTTLVTNSTPIATTDQNTTTVQTSTTTTVTTPPVIYEYLVSIELNTTDVTVIDQLRTLLRNTSFPISINNTIQISDVNISTVCTPSSAGFQCRCEDQYRWSCDQCFLYGSCDNITDDTCGCINAIPPDGQYCQSVDQHNFTACPLTTVSPPPTTPPVVYEYLVSIELNTTDVTVIDRLRTLLRNTSFPISINNAIQISDVNISTVCNQNGTTSQCRCEEQYSWPCDLCTTFGKCDDTIDSTCGCINAIPPDGQFCQPFSNLLICPSTTPQTVTDTTTIAITVQNTTAVLTTPPTVVTNSTTAPTTQENITTIPTTLVTNSTSIATTDQNTTTVQTPAITTVTNSTSIATTDQNTTTVQTPATTTVTNSTTLTTTSPNTTAIPTTNFTAIATTMQNTTALTTLTTVETSSTPNATTDLSTTAVPTIPTTLVTNATMATTDQNTTTVPTAPTTVVTNSTSIATTEQNSTTVFVIDSTTTATTVVNTTAALTSPTTIVTNSTTLTTAAPNTTAIPATNFTATTVQNTTALTTLTSTVTNSTPVATTDLNTTTTTTPPAAVVTNSTTFTTTAPNTTAIPTTTIATTVQNTTAFTTLTTVVTNSTIIATTAQNTTTQPMTTITSSTTTINNQNTTTVSVPPTTAVTNSTTVTSSNQNTTVFSTKATTLVTATTIDTTDQSTTVISTTPTTIVTSPTTTVQNTTTTPASVVTTQSTTNNHTGTMSTTAATQPPTSASTILTTAVPSPTDLTTTATTTNATQSTETPTTTANEETTTITTNSNTVITAAATTTTSAATTLPTTTTSGKVTSTPSTTRETTQPPLTTSVTQQPRFTVELSIRLDREYLVQFNDPTSSEYQQFKTQLEAVFQEQYKGITGFVRVFVTSFRQGSTITDYVVETTSFDNDEMAKANEGLPAAVAPIAPVIGSVAAFHTSEIPISFPVLTYTGQAITLICGPPPENINMGEISGSDWKFKERDIKDNGRFKIATYSNSANLTINNTIAADSGQYECSLKGRVIHFLQRGVLKGEAIKPAPIVRVQNEVNVQCMEGKTQRLKCCVQSEYEVRWFQDSNVLTSDVVDAQKNDRCIEYVYKLESCSGAEEKKQFTCEVVNPSGYQSKTTMTIFKKNSTCNDSQYGEGRENDISKIGCGAGQVGSKSAVCEANGEWRLLEDTCIVTKIKDFLTESETLEAPAVPEFARNLSDVVQNEELQTEITSSTATISAIVDILDVIANVSNVINEPVMQDILETVNVIISDEARESWDILNANESSNASSVLLGSLESISDVLEGEFSISTQRILLNRTAFDNSFRADLNSSIVIDIPDTNLNNVFITTITFSSLDNVLPARNASFNVSSFNATSNETVSDNAINAAVVLVKINATINDVTLSFDKTNNSLTLDPQCVFWNFTLFNNLGGWDHEGCMFVSDINNTVTCNCSHLTSFSILMATSIPQSLRDILDVITFVGVGISLASLVICLIIEGFVWKAMTRNSTSFMRHLSIVNIAVSLLIADICFIIGAAIAKNPLENPGEDHEVPVGPCSTATFFMHFFYLALFFWMLVSGLLLFYRTVMVFSHMSKSVMIAIGFSLGYGCPLIIAVVTVASTASGNGYIQKREACWLNWDETKALLAFVIPALTIVFINFLILIVVLFKMLRRGVGDSVQPDEKSAVVVIARCLAILTPLFGLTWALGVGTMAEPTNKGIHIAFAFFNSLQGFFILVFGTLLDSKIRAALARRLPSSSTGSHQTRSTSGGNSSSSGLDFLRRIRGRRNIYHVSEAANSSNSGASESFTNI